MSRPIDIVVEPTGHHYRTLLESLCAVSAQALSVVRDGFPYLNPAGLRIVEQLRPWFVAERRQSEWPGTILYTQEATVRYYRLDPRLADLLASLVPGLYSWEQPDAPEDLCLLRSDSTPVLVSIAHERDAYLELTRDEREVLAERCPAWSACLRALTHRGKH